MATAAEQGDLAGVQAILFSNPERVNDTGTDYQAALMLAARNGHIETARALLGSGADPNIREKHHNQTALQLAALEGYAEIVELILERGGSERGSPGWIYATNDGGLEPEPSPAIVRALLDKGADITLKEFEGHTALDIAKIRRYQDIVEILTSTEAKNK